jgi:hypothetical protein
MLITRSEKSRKLICKNTAMNMGRERKWPAYDIEVPEKLLAFVYGILILALLIFAVIK